MSRLKCDCCGALVPDVVDPILFGCHGWREFTLDGVNPERGPWEATVLLCDDPGFLGWRRTGHGCASQMAAFVASGGQAGSGHPSPNIRTCRGGQQEEPVYLQAA